MGASLNTVMDAYRIIESTLSDDTESIPATTDFAINNALTEGAFDIMSVDRSGNETGANAAVIIVSATASDADTATIKFYGAADNGPLEAICSVDYIFGTAVKSTGILWADTGTITDTHITTIREGGLSSNDVKRISFDVTGFRYLKAYVTARSGATIFNVWARFF